MDAEQIRKQVQDENTPSKILAELAESKDKEIRRYVAGNPNTPIKTLEKLGEEFPDVIVENPIFDLLLLENPENKFVLLSLARASTTSVEKLEELADYKDRDIKEAVVRNIKTPANILNYIYKAYGYSLLLIKPLLGNKNLEDITLKEIAIGYRATEKSIFYLVLHHPNASENTINLLKLTNKHINISSRFLEKFTTDEHCKIRFLVSKHPSASAKLLGKLSLDNDINIRKNVVLHPNVSIEIIDKMAQKDCTSIKKTIAEHSKATNSILYNLAKDDDYGVRLAIAQIKNISEEILAVLIKGRCWSDNTYQPEDCSWLIKKQVASNPSVPKNIINKLIRENNHHVRAAIAARKDISEGQAMVLAHDRSDIVIKNLIDNPNVSSAVKKFLHILNKSIKSFICIQKCKNTKLNQKKVEELSINAIAKQNIRKIAKDYIHFLRLTLATIPNIPTSAVKEIIDNSEHSFLLGLIDNINTPPEMLEEIAINVEKNSIIQGVIKHFNVSVKTLKKLKNDRHTSIREQVAQNTKISLEIIEELAQDSAPLVRRAIASNPQTSTNILDRLKSDSSLTVRRAVAENKNTSINTLKELLNDEAPKVIESAKDNLNKRSCSA